VDRVDLPEASFEIKDEDTSQVYYQGTGKENWSLVRPRHIRWM
jgi:hypothetical protein